MVATINNKKPADEDSKVKILAAGFYLIDKALLNYFTKISSNESAGVTLLAEVLIISA